MDSYLAATEGLRHSVIGGHLLTMVMVGEGDDHLTIS